jgi:hypothetical protein
MSEPVGRIIRVFPRRTLGTPVDDFVFIGDPPMLIPDAERVHVSVAFSWDREEGERLADAWTVTGLPVDVGGPAYGEPGGEFTPGRYLKQGYTITSRGCPNHCWFCAVPKRERGLRELPIRDGWIVQDDNLLACSEEHIRAVFAMLHRQEHRAQLRGLEAKLLEPWHADLLAALKPQSMYFAYDTPDDLEPLQHAGELLSAVGMKRTAHRSCCYVLIGYPGDTTEAAEKRMHEAWAAGFFPFAMLHRDERGDPPRQWRPFQRRWARPQITNALLREQP